MPISLLWGAWGGNGFVLSKTAGRGIPGKLSMTLEIEICPTTTPNPPLILIVDDDITSSLMLSRFWQKEGYRSLSIQDGQDALLVCEKELPDIILMDAIMPKMDGFNCCQALQKKYGQHCPPILMITGLNDSESVDYAFEVGATDYITKPFHWAVLRQRVRRTMQAHKDHLHLQKTLKQERSLLQKIRVANKELQRLATTDSLTSMANRRVFDERLLHEWKRLRRERSNLSLAIFDIDCFKFYNDTYGHLAGDHCLSEVAQIINQIARRPADLAARYGGEEFALILPNTHTEGAVFLAERVRQNLREKALIHRSSTVQPWITVSIGIATMIPHGDSPQTLIQRADNALYLAKAQGRDRIVTDSQKAHALKSHPNAV